MTSYIISRPIAVIMSFTALIIFSVIAYLKLPISLLPDIDVPELAVRVDYPNTSPEAIEANVLAPIRQSLATMQDIRKIESVASNEAGMVKISFEYGARMDLAYVEANEKIDRLMDQFPREMERPQVLRVNSTDIPVVRVHVTPTNNRDLLEASKLTENVLRKRLEQIEGLSLVDINGLVFEEIQIEPNSERMRIYAITEDDILQSIQNANQELGGIQVKDGQYQYFLRMASRLVDTESIESIPIIKDGDYIELKEIASVRFASKKESGSHLLNGDNSIVLNLHKKSSTDMTLLLPKVKETLSVFEKDYPNISFTTTQDQSIFLKAGINNLLSSLFFGGFFAFAVLFIFMGNPKLPLIMGISLPCSLTISFLFFYFFGLSINIISLSGLALGLGMLIDNAIIVLENIHRKREEGKELIVACTEGVSEVKGALVSSVLTTLAVFVPLIFLNGISGVLFYDQALSVAIILTVSLGVAFILLPLLYKLFFSNFQVKGQTDSLFFKILVNKFNKIHKAVFSKPLIAFFVMLIILPFGYFAAMQLPVQGMPSINRTDLIVKINWQEPISLQENIRRTQQIIGNPKDGLLESDADIGIADYLLQISNASIQETVAYLNFNSTQSRNKNILSIKKEIDSKYPKANVNIEEAPNAFELLFSTSNPYINIKWRLPSSAKENLNDSLQQSFPVTDFEAGKSLVKETNIVINILNNKLLQYNIPQELLYKKLQYILTNYPVTNLKSFSKVTPIVLMESHDRTLSQLIANNIITTSSGVNYPLSTFVKIDYAQRPKHILADASGIYYNMIYNPSNKEENLEQNPTFQLSKIRNWIVENGLLAEIEGEYFSNQKNLQDLLFILLISIALLYFILAAQFESFWQPLIVIFSLPFGIAGAILFLWIGGATLNIMSAIGMVVMLGIMVNDAILKIDTINRNLSSGIQSNVQLTEAIHLAGIVRLKPILMTSITTILALCPVLIAGGLGAELQTPLVLSVMGGLIVGTGTALFLIPLVYYIVKRKFVQ
ncbi:cation transporter [Marivirga lumbricoides]|uniref:Cation transporter n=1 Tax=Marivirga lumbricoides TaxID=1046115 RepID=A0A2T4DVA9_9BACT|nr:cation transporter [Marivirga lumbricoides]